MRIFLGPEAGDEARELVRVTQRHAFDVQLAVAEEFPQVAADVDVGLIAAPCLAVSGGLDSAITRHLLRRCDLTRCLPSRHPFPPNWSATSGGLGEIVLHGFDISAYQNTTVPSCDFVFVKATEGNGYTSSKFAAQWASAKTHAKVRGAYHFARPEQSSGASQADRLLAKAKAVRGEMLCLDLEASDLGQAQTNRWAKAFGDRLREKAPGVTTVVYMGSGYASNGTGKDLSKHFDLWWYPQYPSTSRTHTWRTTFDPWLPGGLTSGWKKPHIWQWTDNFNGLDASITPLTIDKLAGGGQPPMEDDMPYGGQLPAGAGSKANISFPKGSMKAIGLVYDSPNIAEIRVAFHYGDGSGEVYTLKVGGPKSTSDAWPAKTVQKFKKPEEGDWVSLTRVDGGPDPVGWDMS